MLLRVGALLSVLLLVAAAMPASADGLLGGDCGTIVLGTHRSPVLRIDLWVTNVQWGPGGLHVHDQNTGVPGYPGGPGNGNGIPSPYPIPIPFSNQTGKDQGTGGKPQEDGGPPGGPNEPPVGPVPPLPEQPPLPSVPLAEMLDPVMAAVWPLIEDQIPDIVRAIDKPVIQIEVRIPPAHEEYSPDGQRFSFILDLGDCTPERP